MMQMFDLSTPIAFLGIGLMGSRMGQRLLQAGVPLAVWNRTPSACTPLLQQGAAELELSHIGQYPIVMLCLAHDDAVSQVVEQILPFLQSGQILIDFSSLSVDCTRRLAAQVAEKQCIWIDSPVSGGTVGAEQGSLVIFAGGSAEVIHALQPIYAPLSQRVTRMGDVGSGQATKICNQLIVAANSVLIAEAVALAEKSGVDAQLLAPALAGGFADSKPFQILAPRMATHQFEPVQWKVQTLAKDLNNAVHLAQQHQLPLSLARHALQQLQQHQQRGFAEQDLSTVILNAQAEDA